MYIGSRKSLLVISVYRNFIYDCIIVPCRYDLQFEQSAIDIEKSNIFATFTRKYDAVTLGGTSKWNFCISSPSSEVSVATVSQVFACEPSHLATSTLRMPMDTKSTDFNAADDPNCITSSCGNEPVVILHKKLKYIVQIRSAIDNYQKPELPDPFSSTFWGGCATSQLDADSITAPEETDAKSRALISFRWFDDSTIRLNN